MTTTTKSETNIEDATKALFDTVYGIIDELEKNGHPLPKENSKSFYLKSCWVLRWLNQSNRDDYKIRVARRAIKNALPAIREAGI